MKRIEFMTCNRWVQMTGIERFQWLYCPGMAMFEGVADDGV